MKYDISKYDYIMFVDASGDDGFKFDKGSSTCYTVASILINSSDLQHNLSILDGIKSIIGAKPEHELKYTKLRRSRRFNDIANLLTNIKGTIYTHTCLKEDLVNDQTFSDTESKALAQFTHTFPIERAIEHFKNINLFPLKPKVLIVVDVMKKVEMDGVSNLVSAEIDGVVPDLIFRDSKDKNFLLIQLADIIAGMTRNFIEGMLKEKNTLQLCKVCSKTRLRVSHRISKNKCIGKKKFNLLNNKSNTFIEKQHFIKILPLFGVSETDNRLMLHGLAFFPVESIHYFFWIDCLFNKKYKK